MLSSAFLLLALAVSPSVATVRVQGGVLAGAPAADQSTVAFKGVPFAAPPIGDLRWAPPQAPKSWTGVRKADRFSANCMQVMRDSLGPWTSEYQPHGDVSEDCLYLNIWTPAKSASHGAPVVVYFHGGAFTDGSGNVPVYDGENLAKKGLVVVTANYRVGVMGFLAHPELTKESPQKASGNYGLLDQVAALQWIKSNIAAFGGDPSRITIMGQSAGAASVQYLTASPLAKGLFVRAIAQSGAGRRQGQGMPLAEAEQNGARFAAAKGASSLSALRALPAAQVLAVVEGFRFPPIIDGWFLPDSVDSIFSAGTQNDVATLTGWTADEGSFSEDYGKLTPEDFRKRVEQQAGTDAAEVLKLYPPELQKEFARETALVSMHLWAAKRARTAKTPLYTYLFTHPQPGPTKDRYQVFHSSELPYVFDNLNKSDRPWTEEDKKIAEAMSAYWVNFIVTGNPNGNGLPNWAAFSNSATTMELGDKMGVRPIASPQAISVLKTMLTENNR